MSTSDIVHLKKIKIIKNFFKEIFNTLTFFYLLILEIILFTNIFLQIFNIIKFKTELEMLRVSVIESILPFFYIMTIYLVILLDFFLSLFLKLTEYKKFYITYETDKCSIKCSIKIFITSLKEVYLDKKYWTILSHVIKYRINKDRIFISTILFKLTDFYFSLFIIIPASLLLYVLMIILRPSLMKEFIIWINNTINKASIEISNLAILFFTFVLIVIEFRRYNLENAYPKIDISFLSSKGKEIMFKILIMNVSKISYIFEGRYFISYKKKGIIWFKSYNPLLPIASNDYNIYEKIFESEIGDTKILVPPEKNIEHYFTIMNSEENKKSVESFFVLLWFKIKPSHPRHVAFLLERYLSYIMQPPPIYRQQLFLYFIDLKQRKVEQVIKL